MGTGVGLLSGSGVTLAVGAMISAGGKMLDSSGYSKAMDTLDNANLYNLTRATADLTVTTNLMLSKEAKIATDLYSVFDTMEQWRQVDPELPLEIVTADVKDLTVSEDTIFAPTTAAITVLNNHTGSVTVAPTVEIYDSFGMINTVNMGTKTIAPGTAGEFVTDILVPINMLRDMGGYTAVFTFAASEAETMTISPDFGPYVTHFNVGTEAVIDYLRENAQVKQPAGGTLKAGESKTVTVDAGSGNLLYVFAASNSGETGLALTVTGAGTKQTSSHINTDDFVLIRDASGSYTIEVSNNGDTDLCYDIVTVVSPDMGTVIGLDMPYTKVMAGANSYLDGEEEATRIKASIPVSVYETGLTEGADIAISASELQSDVGYTISAPEITDLKGYSTSGSFSLDAGTGKSLMLEYLPNTETPDGDYFGTVKITVAADNFEHELTPIGWVRNGDVYEFTTPVSVRIDTEAPSAATLSAEATSDGRIYVEGMAKPDSYVEILLSEDETSAGISKGTVKADANGQFTAVITPDNSGSYYVYVRTVGENGISGPESERISVIADIGDKTAPVITMVSPQTDIQLRRAVTEIVFTVSDSESPIAEIPTVTVDGAIAEVTQIAEGRYSAIPPTESMEDGTHTIRISATSGGGTAIKTFTVIIGEKIEAVVSVTADDKQVSGALVTMNGETKATTDSGTATFTVKAGTYQYSVSMDGYLTESGTAYFSAASRTVNVVLTAGGALQVVVTADGQPVENAAVTLGKWSAVSSSNGTAELQLPYGTYSYQITAAGYKAESGSFTFTKATNEPLCVELKVNKSDTLPAYFSITDAAGVAICGIDVTLDGETQKTDTNGDVMFLKNVGTYEYSVGGGSYKTQTGSVKVASSDNKQNIVLTATGADYDEEAEIISLEAGYKAWTAATGGEEIKNGDVVERESENRIIYIEDSEGNRVPFMIPAVSEQGRVWVENVDTAESGIGILKVTVENYKLRLTEDIVLVGSLEDADGKCIDVKMFDISDFKSGEQRVITIDFGQDTANYTCKLFLWGKNSLMPLCPAYLVCEAPIPEGKVWIDDVKVGESGKLEVTVRNYYLDIAEDIALIGSISDINGECVDTRMITVSGLTAGKTQTVTVDFGQDIENYTCKLFLWGKNSLMPLCPKYLVCEAPIPENGRIRIKNAQLIDGIGKIAVTVDNFNCTQPYNIALIGSLEDAAGECVDTRKVTISGLTAGKTQTVILDFGQNIGAYTCKLVLWDMSLLLPLCPRWDIGK